jgi:hypothetical protein
MWDILKLSARCNTTAWTRDSLKAAIFFPKLVIHLYKFSNIQISTSVTINKLKMYSIAKLTLSELLKIQYSYYSVTNPHRKKKTNIHIIQPLILIEERKQSIGHFSISTQNWLTQATRWWIYVLILLSVTEPRAYNTATYVKIIKQAEWAHMMSAKWQSSDNKTNLLDSFIWVRYKKWINNSIVSEIRINGVTCSYSCCYITWVIQWLRLALSKGPNRVGIPLPSPEDRNTSSFQNTVFSSI